MLHRLAVPLAAALLSVGFAAVAAPAPAASATKPVAGQHCRDKSGKFVACPSKTPAKPCRDSKGHFAKCPG